MRTPCPALVVHAPCRADGHPLHPPEREQRALKGGTAFTHMQHGTFAMILQNDSVRIVFEFLEARRPDDKREAADGTSASRALGQASARHS